MRLSQLRDFVSIVEAGSIRAAAKAFLEDPLGAPLIPNWNRIQSALPRFLEDLNEAVKLDNE